MYTFCALPLPLRRGISAAAGLTAASSPFPADALHIDTKKLSGAGNLLGVLAANTFQFTQQVLVGQGSSPASLWSIIHKADGTLIAPYTKLTKYQRASVVLFAGLICNNISNILCSMLVVEPVVAGAAAEAPAAEAPAKEAEEAAVAV